LAAFNLRLRKEKKKEQF